MVYVICKMFKAVLICYKEHSHVRKKARAGQNNMIIIYFFYTVFLAELHVMFVYTFTIYYDMNFKGQLIIYKRKLKPNLKRVFLNSLC